MNDSTLTHSRTARWAAGAVLLAAGALAGGVLASSLSANAATPTPTPSGSSSTSTQRPEANFPGHGSAAHERAENPVTGADATKAQAAAVKAVGSGKAGAVTTDMTQTGYELTVTKSDGSKVEVHLDKSFNVHDHGGFGG